MFKLNYENIFPEERYPSREFYLKTNIEGLYTDWNIDLEIFIYRFLFYYNIRYSFISNIIYKICIKKNPILLNIVCINSDRRANVLWGVLSKFNYDDIKFFVENFDNIIEYNMKNRILKDSLTKKYGIFPEWVLSPETLKTKFNICF